MLVRLLYVSRAVDPNSSLAIDAILASARNHNLSQGITGILCYGGGIYLQALEGGRNQVNGLYNHIVSDKRHKDVVLLHYEEIAERRFAGGGGGLSARQRASRHGGVLAWIGCTAVDSGRHFRDTTLAHRR